MNIFAHLGCVSRRNSLYFVYTPMPHVIVGAQMDGASEKLYSTTFRPLQRILDLRFETMMPPVPRNSKEIP